MLVRDRGLYGVILQREELFDVDEAYEGLSPEWPTLRRKRLNSSLSRVSVANGNREK